MATNKPPVDNVRKGGVRKRSQPRTKDNRLQIMLNHEELEAIDNWRFKMRMPNRAAAVRELINRGLRADGFDSADGRKSSDYGVLNRH